MRINLGKKKVESCGGEGKFRVLLYSRRASLVREFCLDSRKDEVADLQDAEQRVRDTLTPCDFAAMTVTIVGEDGRDGQSIVQFGLDQPE